MKKYRIDEITINLDNLRKPLNNIERSKISDKKLYPYFGANNLMDYVDEYIFDEEILCVAEDGGSWGFRERCSYIVNEKCWVNNHAHVLKANKNLNLKFLSYYLNYNDLSSNITGTTRGKLTKSALNSIEILLPELSEQNKIVVILDKAQSLIDKRKEQIETCDELVKSLFYEMFGEIKKNKKNYQIKKLDDITNKITDGVHSKPNYTTDGIPFISVKDINTSKIIFNNCKYISQEDHESYCKRCKPERGDLLYTKVGATYGIPAVVDTDKEFSLYVSVALIKPNKDEVNSIYLRESLRSICIKRQADNAIKGIGVPDLHLIEIKKFQIMLPPLSLQNKFAAQVEKIEQQKQLLEQSLKELENNFNSLMQRAFKGELF